MGYTAQNINVGDVISSEWGNKIEQHLARLGNYRGVIDDAANLPDPTSVDEGDWYLVLTTPPSISVAQAGAWVQMSVDWADIINKPSQFPPEAHASQHAAGGSDPITPADIEAVAQAADYDSGWITVSANTTYTFNHNLGKLPSNFIFLFRENDTYTMYGIIDFIVSSTGQFGAGFAISETEIKFRTSDNYVNSPKSTDMGISSGPLTTAEYRILMWK